MRIIVLATLFSTVSITFPAFAADVPECPGKLQLTRTFRVKEGKWDLFEKAIKDHQAWYVSQGRPDKILLGRVLRSDSLSKSLFYSSTVATMVRSDLSLPIEPAALNGDDPAWNALVTEYRESSEIVNTITTCVEPVAN